MDDRDQLATTIYGDGTLDGVEWLTTVDDSPNVASYALADRVLAAGWRPPVDFLTVNEVADRLRISKMTVYRLCESGELPCRKIGRSFRIPRADFDAYLAGAEA